ncbi:hypothetical protein F2Q69_00039464 [Brassica cretica]|uniref:Uncharacterized protein n=1 Tax=Brassica cretica TaxID=69181 RepID=A0A8S9NGV2_BRACR|nr:hypothetical protein F2Q69_00039464 [Brassica cretica]
MGGCFSFGFSCDETLERLFRWLTCEGYVRNIEENLTDLKRQMEDLKATEDEVENRVEREEGLLHQRRRPAVKAFLKIGIRGVTVSDVRGFGAQGGSTERHGGKLLDVQEQCGLALPLSKFNDPCNGYIDEDACTVGVEIFVIKPKEKVEIITHNPPNKLFETTSSPGRSLGDKGKNGLSVYVDASAFLPNTAVSSIYEKFKLRLLNQKSTNHVEKPCKR